MKKIVISTLVLIAIATLFSCNQQPKEEQEFDTLMKKIIAVHDEVMPKMGEISSLIKKLEPKVDTTAIGKPYETAQKKLKGSYDFMMEWMSDFSKKFPYDQEVTSDNKEEFDAKLKLLKEEEQEVNDLKEQVNFSIDLAKKLLEKS